MEEVARAMSAGGEEIKIENKTLKLEKFRLIQKTDLKLILNKQMGEQKVKQVSDKVLEHLCKPNI